MFGCHNCGKNPQKITSFEKTPCANCRAAQDPRLLSYYSADPAVSRSLQVMHPAYEETDEIDLKKKLFSALSQAVMLMISLKERYPETYRIVEAKMGNPSLSYSELARIFDCKKQNILYHLKRAVALCPELSCVMIVDSRFSAGRRAVSRPVSSAYGYTGSLRKGFKCQNYGRIVHSPSPKTSCL